jgi:hypothetical protein
VSFAFAAAARNCSAVALRLATKSASLGGGFTAGGLSVRSSSIPASAIAARFCG